MSNEIDPQDTPGSHGYLAIVYMVVQEGGILGLTAHIINAMNKEPFCVPMERYGVLMDVAPTKIEIQELKQNVKEKRFSEKKQPLVSLQQVHRNQHESNEHDSEEDSSDKKLQGMQVQEDVQGKMVRLCEKKDGMQQCKCKESVATCTMSYWVECYE